MRYIIVFLFVVLISCNREETEAKEKLKTHIKSTLKDPNSFQVYSQEVEKEGHVFIITIDYGAKNGFGGMVRVTERYSVVGNYVGRKN